MLTTDQSSPLADVTACADCGHLIAGLPAATGRCPECGAAYSRRELVVFGRPGRRLNVYGITLASAPINLIGSWSLFAGDHGPLRWLAAVGLVTWVSILVGFAWHAVVGRSTSARLRVSADGCAVDLRVPPSPVHDAIATVINAFRRPRVVTAVPWILGVRASWRLLGGVRLTPTRRGEWRVRTVRRAGLLPRVDVVLTATPEQVSAFRSFAARLATMTDR